MSQKTFVHFRKKFKKIIKTCKEKVHKLPIEEKTIKKYMKIVEGMEEDFIKIIREENVERELRKAEVETKKIENMLNHKDEIFNRPRK